MSYDSLLHYKITDHYLGLYPHKTISSFDLLDTNIVQSYIEYNPKTKRYDLTEKIGNSLYRTPTTFSYAEFLNWQNRKDEEDYFKERARNLSLLNRTIKRPQPRMYDRFFNRLFGLSPDGFRFKFQLQGTIDMTMGYVGQYVKNPILPERARRTGGFNFNFNSNIQANVQVGEKLKMPINYNTLANFDFENQIKVDYQGTKEELIKYIKAGNISWQSKGTLIPSIQSLFGISSQIQLGRLFISGTIANQRSQTQNLNLQGGNAVVPINKSLNDYDENRNFLLAQYFKQTFNNTMSSLPIVNSLVQIQRIEVWVTNRIGLSSAGARPIVALTDLGEITPQNQQNQPLTNNPLPANGANNLYNFLIGNTNNRSLNFVIANLQARGLNAVDDYEQVYARLLSPSEYFINTKAGFIALNAQVQANDVLAVAFQYTVNGKVYQVGEFSNEVPNDSMSGVQKVLFLKMLKATSQRPPNSTYPNRQLWGLMMKNVYSLDVGAIQKTDFFLDFLYNQPDGGTKRYLPVSSPSVEGKPLISILGADRLNRNGDPQPDGIYDLVDSFTYISSLGRIVVPVLEPFGRDLNRLAFSNIPSNVSNNYVYYQLYDSIKAIAKTFANVDRFQMRGQVRGSGGSEIYLGAFNVPPGSVKVTAGGQPLVEGVDFIVDYNLGTVKIVNQNILASGVPVSASFENNNSFGTQQKTFMALRIDYLFNKNLVVGATIAKLSERPYFNKLNYGDDPISNTIYGLDFNYKAPLPFLTRWLNKLPFYSSTTTSTISSFGEIAFLKPGHASQIGKGNKGQVYIDDFEAATSSIDLRFPYTSWSISSTPNQFPESQLMDSLPYGYNRARLSVYAIEPILQDRTNVNNPLRNNLKALSDPRTRQILTQEIYPQETIQPASVLTQTFDMAYFPKDPGPYNYVSNPNEINANGQFINPTTKWGGVMRALPQTDFETNNIQYVEFYVQDPFVTNPNSNGGKLYIDMGLINEDILKDGKRSYEQGLPTPTIPALVDNNTKWGKVPLNPIAASRSFSNNPADRPYQDVGFDGLSDEEERIKFRDFLDSLSYRFGTNSKVYKERSIDPSNDDYVWYRDQRYDNENADIIARYKYHNNTDGNSPVSTANGQLTPAATLFPDDEDIDGDGVLNQVDQFYEYEVDLSPNMSVGVTPFVTDKRTVIYTAADGTSKSENWYVFRIPITSYTSKIGTVSDFRNMRHIRMYMTGFSDSTVLRFAELSLVRNSWRNFTFSVDTSGAYKPLPTNTNTTLDIVGVNLIENSNRSPVNYVLPPGVERVGITSTNGVNLLENEQSMSLRLRNLAPGDARAVLKTVNLDLRQYSQMSMFIHAESVINQTPIQDGDMVAVVRIGQDFLTNYYEIRVPLKVTPPGTNYQAGSTTVWPTENNLDFSLPELVNLKLRRNAAGLSSTKYYSEVIGNKTFAVYGNPNLGQVYGILVGVQNNNQSNATLNSEVWVNELRLSGLNEKGGWAALGRVDLQLADLGLLSVSGNTYSVGWGSIDQKVNDRARNSFYQIDAGLSLNISRLLPRQLGLNIPFYGSVSRTVKTPEYDPYDQDIKLKYQLAQATSKEQRDSIRRIALTQQTITTLSLTNVGLLPRGKSHFWNPSNIALSYAYLLTQITDPIIQKNDYVTHHFILSYAYNAPIRTVEPFKKILKKQNPWYQLIRDFNFNWYPSVLGFRAEINRQFGTYIPRIVAADKEILRVDTTYDKYLTFNRFYNLHWDFSRSLNFNFTAENFARVDEPYGAINTREKRDTILTRLLSGGRNIIYTHKASLTYTLPFSKFPLTDWMNVQLNYGIQYKWIAASLLAKSLGNFLENGQERQATVQVDFYRIYQKSKFLRTAIQEKNMDIKERKLRAALPPPPSVDIPVLPPKKEILVDKDGNKLIGKAKRLALKKWRALRRYIRKLKRTDKRNQPIQLNAGKRFAGNLLTMFKSGSINYSETFHTRIPGWLDSTQVLGVNLASMQPGWDFIAGQQPSFNWLNNRASKGLFTRDSLFNELFRQNYTQKYDVNLRIEPVRELTIDINLQQSFSKDYQSLFKDTMVGSTANNYMHLAPLSGGGFSISYVAIGTLFNKVDPNRVSNTFLLFQEYRKTLSLRLAEKNPYWIGSGKPMTPSGYAKGYSQYAQNVLIPSFIAAYSNRDPNKVGTIKESFVSINSNPFSSYLPLPNWNISYAGLTRIPFMAEAFSNFTILHAYQGSLSMNSYSSLLNFYDPLRIGSPSFIDPISGNYVPFYLLPNISIQEQFSPLAGVDLTTVNQISLRLEYKKMRQLSLSLIDFQLSEVNSTEWLVGIAWRKKGLKLPFRIPFTRIKVLENDINFRVDIGFRDDVQTNSQLDQLNAYNVGGQKVWTIQPSIDYIISNTVNLRLFFDQRRVIPYTSAAPPIISTSAGVQIRVSLNPPQ
ncbi:MAG: cell surface protein SprA [Phycisphaerales bacterium]|nr:cell surface protein SprA [Phycisphaerales bacterium]